MALYIADVTMHDEQSSEEEYDENADEDFNPDKANAEDEQSSSEEEDQGKSRVERSATKKPAEDVHDALDSGDEVTIKEQKRRRRKKDANDGDASADEGGFIMTRAQRLAAKVEKKERKKANAGDVTIDVEKAWADLSSLPIGRPVSRAIEPMSNEAADDGEQKTENIAQQGSDQMITIKRRIEYAGEVTEVEEQVPKSSKDAQRYLAEHPEADPDHASHHADSSGLHRPLKRPSMFEPNPLGAVKGVPMEKLRPRAPSRMDVLMAEKRVEEEKRRKAQKMTTVQKSALDWKGFVDQEGIRDELDEYGKSKRGFLAREAFLDRAAGAREQAARDARLKS